MRIAIHQPHYLPWPRYFEKIARCDCFILLDDVQYEKNGFQNRNRIKTPQGWCYLTVPVRRPSHRRIDEVEIDNTSPWRERHRRSLELSYRRAPCFDRYWPELLGVYEQEWIRLESLNRVMLDLFLRQLQIATPVLRSSELRVAGGETERLVALCLAAGGTDYLTGSHAAGTYLDQARFREAGIRVALQEWRPPRYKQPFPAAGFVPDLSIVDLLFSCGEQAKDTLLQAGSIRCADDESPS